MVFFLLLSEQKQSWWHGGRHRKFGAFRDLSSTRGACFGDENFFDRQEMLLCPA